ATSAKPDRHFLLARALDQLGLLVEEAKPAFGRANFGPPDIRLLRSSAVLLKCRDQRRALLLVAPVILLQACDSSPPSLLVAGEGCGMRPGPMRLECHDLRRGVAEKFAVMTDIEERLSAGRHGRFEPFLALDVE